MPKRVTFTKTQTRDETMGDDKTRAMRKAAHTMSLRIIAMLGTEPTPPKHLELTEGDYSFSVFMTSLSIATCCMLQMGIDIDAYVEGLRHEHKLITARRALDEMEGEADQ